jgi:hypothetical protein
MTNATIKTQVALVLCHSVLHDAFRVHKPVDAEKFKSWMASRFVVNFIIEMQAGLPEGVMFAFTSKQVFEDFTAKFEGDKPSPKLTESVGILHNSIYVVDSPVASMLSIDDGVFFICDVLYSRSNYSPTLISNIPSKKEKAEAFYRKNGPKAIIPYPILNVLDAETYLRKEFPELCKLVDSRLKFH